MSKSTEILSVRVSAHERDLLAQAADQGQTSLSDFVRRKAVEAAELAVMSRSVVRIPAEDWERFEAWATAPAKDKPELAELAAHPVAWRS
jgi:uncharacterized protein (DUF1778 family)